MPPRSSRTFGPSHPDWSPQPELLMRLLVANPRVLEIAALIPAKPSGTCGRPRENPDELTALVWCAKGAFKSLRAAATWFRDEVNWTWLKANWRAAYGLELSEQSPARKTFELQLKRMRPLTALIADRLSELALDEAKRQGRFTGTSQTMGCPPRSNVIAVDGTVPKLRMKQTTIERLRAAGEPRKRNGHRMSIPVGERYKEGGGNWAFGPKYVVAVSRPDAVDDNRNLRLVMAVKPSTPGDGGEAAAAVEMIHGLRRKSDQVQGVRYDGALRGAHLAPLIRSGVSVVSNPGETDSMSRLPFAEGVECRCGGEHDLYTEGGWLCIGEVLDTGELHVERLNDRDITFVRNRGNGDYRCYLTVMLPCGNRYRTRLDTTRADVAKKYKRSERLRQHPPGSPEYDQTYGWRNDVESHNNNLDSTHYRGRMIADRPDDQYLVMLAHGFVQNVLAEAVYDDLHAHRESLRAA